MSRMPYLLLSGTIFLIVALLHFLRLVYGVSVVIGGWVVPVWPSYFGLPVAGAIGLWGFTLARRRDA